MYRSSSSVVDLHSKIQWWIYIVKFWTRPVQFLHLHAVLGEIWANNRPPLGNPRSAVGHEWYLFINFWVSTKKSHFAFWNLFFQMIQENIRGEKRQIISQRGTDETLLELPLLEKLRETLKISSSEV